MKTYMPSDKPKKPLGVQKKRGRPRKQPNAHATIKKVTLKHPTRCLDHTRLTADTCSLADVEKTPDPSHTNSSASDSTSSSVRAQRWRDESPFSSNDSDSVPLSQVQGDEETKKRSSVVRNIAIQEETDKDTGQDDGKMNSGEKESGKQPDCSPLQLSSIAHISFDATLNGQENQKKSPFKCTFEENFNFGEDKIPVNSDVGPENTLKFEHYLINNMSQFLVHGEIFQEIISKPDVGKVDSIAYADSAVASLVKLDPILNYISDNDQSEKVVPFFRTNTLRRRRIISSSEHDEIPTISSSEHDEFPTFSSSEDEGVSENSSSSPSRSSTSSSTDSDDEATDCAETNEPANNVVEEALSGQPNMIVVNEMNKVPLMTLGSTDKIDAEDHSDIFVTERPYYSVNQQESDAVLKDVQEIIKNAEVMHYIEASLCGPMQKDEAENDAVLFDVEAAMAPASSVENDVVGTSNDFAKNAIVKKREDLICVANGNLVEDDSEVLYIEAVLLRRRYKCSWQYLIKYKNQPLKRSTWEDESILTCFDHIEAFEKRLPTPRPVLANPEYESLGPSGLALGLEAEKIIGAGQIKGETFFLVKWKGSNRPEFVCSTHAYVKFNGLIYDFFENNAIEEGEELRLVASNVDRSETINLQDLEMQVADSLQLKKPSDGCLSSESDFLDINSVHDLSEPPSHNNSVPNSPGLIEFDF